MQRCSWCLNHPLYIDYHDQEWGVPEHDDQRLFAKLILDGAQAGLSWLTILKKREGYYRAFEGLDPEKMARYDDARIAELLEDPGIVRNRAKVSAAVRNARSYLALRDGGRSFDSFLWQFVGGRTIQNCWSDLGGIPTQTDASTQMSRELSAAGFRFVGPTICYAFMQAVGMVNDHVVACFRHRELNGG
jgi:DNA-3-methyladenine glycosylase I